MEKERIVNNINTCELGDISEAYNTAYLNYLLLVGRVCDDNKITKKSKHIPSLKELLYTNFIGVFDMKYGNSTITLHFNNPVVFMIEHDNNTIEVTLLDIITNIFLNVNSSSNGKHVDALTYIKMRYCSHLNNNQFQKIIISKLKSVSVTGSKSSFLWNMRFSDSNNKKIYFSEL